jgi:hypothetical protein
LASALDGELEIIIIIIIIVIVVFVVDVDVSCRRHFLPDNSLEPTVISTPQASGFTLQYFIIIIIIIELYVIVIYS